MALDLATIQAIASRKGNQFLQDQVNLASQLIAKKGLEKEKVEGAVRIVNVESGGVDSVSIVAGGASLPGIAGDSIGSGEAPQQLFVRPVNMVGQIRVPMDSAKVVSGKADSINLVKKQFDLIGKNMGQQQGRQMLKCVVATYTAQDTGTDIATGASAQLNKSSTLTDIRGLRVGQSYDVYAASSGVPTGSRLGRVTVQAAPITSNSAAGNVTVLNLATYEGVAGATISGSTGAARCLVLPGSYGAAASRVPLDLATAVGSGTVYGTSVSNVDWSGNDGASATLTPSALRELMDSCEVRSGKTLTSIVMGRLALTEFEEALLAGGASSAGGGTRFFTSAQDKDTFADPTKKFFFRGVEVIFDDNCPSLEVYLISKEGQAIGEWQPLQAMSENGIAQVSQTQFAYLMQAYGMSNLVVDSRNSIGRFNISAFS